MRNPSFLLNQVKMTEKWVEIQGKWDFVIRHAQFEISKFRSSRFYSINLLS